MALQRRRSNNIVDPNVVSEGSILGCSVHPTKKDPSLSNGVALSIVRGFDKKYVKFTDFDASDNTENFRYWRDCYLLVSILDDNRYSYVNNGNNPPIKPGDTVLALWDNKDNNDNKDRDLTTIYYRAIFRGFCNKKRSCIVDFEGYPKRQLPLFTKFKETNKLRIPVVLKMISAKKSFAMSKALNPGFIMENSLSSQSSTVSTNANNNYTNNNNNQNTNVNRRNRNTNMNAHNNLSNNNVNINRRIRSNNANSHNINIRNNNNNNIINRKDKNRNNSNNIDSEDEMIVTKKRSKTRNGSKSPKKTKMSNNNINGNRKRKMSNGDTVQQPPKKKRKKQRISQTLKMNGVHSNGHLNTNINIDSSSVTNINKNITGVGNINKNINPVKVTSKKRKSKSQRKRQTINTDLFSGNIMNNAVNVRHSPTKDNNVILNCNNNSINIENGCSPVQNKPKKELSLKEKMKALFKVKPTKNKKNNKNIRNNNNNIASPKKDIQLKRGNNKNIITTSPKQALKRQLIHSEQKQQKPEITIEQQGSIIPNNAAVKAKINSKRGPLNTANGAKLIGSGYEVILTKLDHNSQRCHNSHNELDILIKQLKSMSTVFNKNIKFMGHKPELKSSNNTDENKENTCNDNDTNSDNKANIDNNSDSNIIMNISNDKCSEFNTDVDTLYMSQLGLRSWKKSEQIHGKLTIASYITLPKTLQHK